MAINLGSGFFTVAMQNNLSGPMGRLQKKLGISTRAIAAAGVAMAAAVAAAVITSINKFAEFGDEVHKMALKTGFSTEALSELGFAAEQSGASLETIGKGIKRMAKFLEDAKDGLSVSVDALEKLNLTAAEFVGLSPEEAFFKLANAIAELEDPLQKAAIAQDVFGRAGTDLLPMLAAGADGIEKLRQEARDLNISLSQESADAAARYTDSMNAMRKGLLGLSNIIAEVLIGDVTDGTDAIVELLKMTIAWIKENKPLIKSLIEIGIWLVDLSIRFNPVFKSITTLWSWWKPIMGMFNDWRAGGNSVGAMWDKLANFMEGKFAGAVQFVGDKITWLLDIISKLPAKLLGLLLGGGPIGAIGGALINAAEGDARTSSAIAGASSARTSGSGGAAAAATGAASAGININFTGDVNVRGQADINALARAFGEELQRRLSASGQPTTVPING